MRVLPRRRLQQVHAAHDAVLDAFGHRRLHVVLVVEREVVEAILGFGPVHAADAVAHEHADLVRERGVVRAAVRVRERVHLRLPVAVLQPLARQRGAARGGAEQEAAAALVAERPDHVADALEAEHRIEDVERDHRLAPRRVRGGGRGERRHRARLGDPLFEELAVGGLAVREHQARVDRLVLLAERRVDLELGEQRVETERARLVGNDRHDARPELGLLQQHAQQTARTPSWSTPAPSRRCPR